MRTIQIESESNEVPSNIYPVQSVEEQRPTRFSLFLIDKSTIYVAIVGSLQNFSTKSWPSDPRNLVVTFLRKQLVRSKSVSNSNNAETRLFL